MPRNPRPLSHEVVRGPSDHKGYIVTYRLPEGGQLTIGTINLSIKAVKRRKLATRAWLAAFAQRCDVVLIQEAGAARQLVQQAASDAGLLVYFGQGKLGQASTPVMARRALSPRFSAYPLLGRRQLAPEAAGPSRSKPKWLMVAEVEVHGHGAVDLCSVGNVHATPSTRYRLNAIAAGLIFHRAERQLLRLPGWAFGGGDLNQPWWSRIIRIWRPRLRSSQRILGALNTGPHHTPIDDVYAEHRPRRQTTA